ncbi:MAG TPA: thioredoxin family protein [Geobacteraceae bacterium]
MYQRLVISFAVMACAWIVLSLMKRRQTSLASRASQQLNTASPMPTIVYFWSDGCSVCKMTQRPILEGILAEYGAERLTLTAYNIDEAPDVAKEWGVRTLPTTFLLDSTRSIRHVNNGLAVREDLRKQLEPMIVQ